jgi:ribosome modulation factor
MTRERKLLQAFRRGIHDSVSRHSISCPPYKDRDRTEAWEWGWRFHRMVIERREPMAELRKRAEGQ